MKVWQIPFVLLVLVTVLYVLANWLEDSQEDERDAESDRWQ